MIPLLLAALLSSPARSEEDRAQEARVQDDELRIGLFVGNDEGATGQVPLIFATADARKMRDLFVQYGEIEPSDAILLLDEGRRNVQDALVKARQRIERAEAEGRSTTVLLYYSGHGDEERLQLGTTSISHDELRQWLEESGADVRIAFLDACRSGAAIRQKGGVRGPSYDFAVEVEEIRGTAILTSSAASEFSQESQELGGGFFTHYLHTALSGAADGDADGDVTLTEAYAYVHSETAFGTRDTPGTQTPGFDFDLSGSGVVRLTRLERADAWLSFPGDFEGTYAVWDATRKRYVAEVRGAEPSRLAVRAGTVHVHRRLPGWVDEAEYRVDSGETAEVSETDFYSVAYADTEARGSLEREVRRASRSRISLRGGLGLRGFGFKTRQAQEYLPPHPVLVVEGRFLHPVRRGPYYSVDLLTGAAPGVIHIPERGDIDVTGKSASLGVAAGYASAPNLFRFGIGGKVELIWMGREFRTLQLDAQDLVWGAAGINPWAGIQYGSWNADFTWNIMLLPVQLDEVPGFPTYGEVLLTVGYRL